MGGSGWWLIGVVLMVVCMVAMARMMGHGQSAHDSAHDRSNHEGSNDPERMLGDRLARGEIDVDEYERLLEALRRTDSLSHT